MVVTFEDSLTAARRLSKDGGDVVMVLNMANNLYPGGAFMYGDWSQEEYLTRHTTLLHDIDPAHLQSGSHPAPVKYVDEINNLIQSFPGKCFLDTEKPRVCFKGRLGELSIDAEGMPFFEGFDKLLPDEEIFHFYEMRAAAFARDTCAITESQLYAEILRRIKAQLLTAQEQGCRRLVLGAFGCGVFQNPPEIVAECYREALLNFAGAFDEVVFPVYVPDRSEASRDVNYTTFYNKLNGLSLDKPENNPDLQEALRYYQEQATIYRSYQSKLERLIVNCNHDSPMLSELNSMKTRIDRLLILIQKHIDNKYPTVEELQGFPQAVAWDAEMTFYPPALPITNPLTPLHSLQKFRIPDQLAQSAQAFQAQLELLESLLTKENSNSTALNNTLSTIATANVTRWAREQGSESPTIKPLSVRLANPLNVVQELTKKRGQVIGLVTEVPTFSSSRWENPVIGGTYYGKDGALEDSLRRTTYADNVYPSFASPTQGTMSFIAPGMYEKRVSVRDQFCLRRGSEEGFSTLEESEIFPIKVINIKTIDLRGEDGEIIAITEAQLLAIKEKIRTILDMFIKNNIRSMVLPAFSCSHIFGKKDPSQIAAYFKEALEEKSTASDTPTRQACFDQIVFAIYDPEAPVDYLYEVYQAFCKTLGAALTEEEISEALPQLVGKMAPQFLTFALTKRSMEENSTKISRLDPILNTCSEVLTIHNEPTPTEECLINRTTRSPALEITADLAAGGPDPDITVLAPSIVSVNGSSSTAESTQLDDKAPKQIRLGNFGLFSPEPTLTGVAEEEESLSISSSRVNTGI